MRLLAIGGHRSLDWFSRVANTARTHRALVSCPEPPAMRHQPLPVALPVHSAPALHDAGPRMLRRTGCDARNSRSWAIANSIRSLVRPVYLCSPAASFFRFHSTASSVGAGVKYCLTIAPRKLANSGVQSSKLTSGCCGEADAFGLAKLHCCGQRARQRVRTMTDANMPDDENPDGSSLVSFKEAAADSRAHLCRWTRFSMW